MYMKGLCENVKGAWDWLFHEHISRRIMAVFVIFFLISFFLTYSLYSWAARKQEDSMIEQSSVQMVTGVRNNLDEMVLNVNDDFNMLLKGGTLDVVNHLPRPEDRKTYDNMLFTALDKMCIRDRLTTMWMPGQTSGRQDGPQACTPRICLS